MFVDRRGRYWLRLQHSFKILSSLLWRVLCMLRWSGLLLNDFRTSFWCLRSFLHIYIFFSTYPLLTALNFLMETCWWYAVKVMEDFTKSEWLQRRWRPDILLWDGIIQDSLGALYFFFRLTYPLNSLSNSFICYVQGDPFPRQEQNAIDIVVQFALNKLNFPAERIILYGWSIGGFTGTFIGYLMARRHYWLQY